MQETGSGQARRRERQRGERLLARRPRPSRCKPLQASAKEAEDAPDSESVLQTHLLVLPHEAAAEKRARVRRLDLVHRLQRQLHRLRRLQPLLLVAQRGELHVQGEGARREDHGLALALVLGQLHAPRHLRLERGELVAGQQGGGGRRRAVAARDVVLVAAGARARAAREDSRHPHRDHAGLHGLLRVLHVHVRAVGEVHAAHLGAKVAPLLGLAVHGGQVLVREGDLLAPVSAQQDRVGLGGRPLGRRGGAGGCLLAGGHGRLDLLRGHEGKLPLQEQQLLLRHPGLLAHLLPRAVVDEGVELPAEQEQTPWSASSTLEQGQ